MTTRSRFRLLGLGGFLACAAGLGFAYYLQFRGYDPCPLCVFQRVAMAAVALIFVAAVIHGPKDWGRWAYSVGAVLAALVGVGIAARHVWLQNLPPELAPACGASLDHLMNIMPFRDVVAMVLKGDSSCAQIDAQWLGLSLPAWTMIAFIGLALYAVSAPAIASRKEGHA